MQVGMNHHALWSTGTHRPPGCDPQGQRGADLPGTSSEASGHCCLELLVLLPPPAQWGPAFTPILVAVFVGKVIYSPDLMGLRSDIAIAR